eukprot:g449.t1
MPQDRVSEFASLTPIQRLQETQRAIDPSLHQMHQQLMEMADNSSSAKEALKKLQKDLESAESRRNHLQNDIVRIQQVQQLKQQVEYCEAKILVINLRKAIKTQRTSKKKLTSGIKHLSNAEKDYATIEAKYKEAIKELSRKERKLTELKEKIRTLSLYINERTDKMEKTEDEIDTQMDQLANLERESRRQQRTIQELQASVERTREETEEVEKSRQESRQLLNNQSEIVKRLTQKLRKVHASMTQTEEQYQILEQKKNEIQVSMRRLDQVKIRRVLALEKRRPLFRGLSRAYDTIQRHLAEFKKPVFGPLITEVSVTEDHTAAFLEQHVPLAVWTFIIVQCREDHNKIKSLDLVPDLNVVNFNGRPEDFITEIQVNRDLAQKGVLGCLADQFEADPVVKAVLNEECNLAQTFVGSEHAEEFIDEIFSKNNRIQKLFTPQKSFTIKRSRYSNDTTTLVTAVDAPALLGSVSLSAEEKVELENQLQGINQSLVATAQDLSQRKEVYEDTKSDLQLQDSKKKEIQNQVKDSEKKLGSLQFQLNDVQRRLNNVVNLPDPIHSEQIIKEELKTLQDTLCSQSRNLAVKQREQGQLIQENSCSMTAFHCLKLQDSIAQRQTRQSKEKVLYHKQLVKDLEDIVNKDSENVDSLERELDSRFPQIDDWKRKLDALSDNCDDIEATMTEAKHKINVMTVNNPDALRTYEELGEKIEILKVNLEEAKAATDESNSQIEEFKGNWLSRIQEAVSQINSAFSDNIEAIGCVGVVALAGEETHGNNFKDYAIDIKVKFRHGEPLKPLDSTRQSGGERACGIALYFLSLQAVAKIPFRVMDEINKGMDEVNERRLMDLLSSNTSSGEFPQTFLFTPKTIPECRALENATTLIIQSGSFVNNQNEQG